MITYMDTVIYKISLKDSFLRFHKMIIEIFITRVGKKILVNLNL